MKKIVSIVLIAFLCLMVLTSGVYAKASSTEGVDKQKGNSQMHKEELDDENEIDDETEQGEVEGTANQAKNYGQEKKLEECIRVRGMNMKFDVPPVIKEGRTLIPVRAIMNGLGADVQWDQETNTVTITRDDVTIVLNLETGDTAVNGESITLDVPAQVLSNRTFVPLRFIAQTLGEKVSYNEETGEVDIGEDTEDEDTEEEIADENDEDTDDTEEDTENETTQGEDTEDENTEGEDTQEETVA